MSNRKKFKVSYIIDIELDNVENAEVETKEQAAIEALRDNVQLSTVDGDIVTDISVEAM